MSYRIHKTTESSALKWHMYIVFQKVSSLEVLIQKNVHNKTKYLTVGNNSNNKSDGFLWIIAYLQESTKYFWSPAKHCMSTHYLYMNIHTMRSNFNLEPYLKHFPLFPFHFLNTTFCDNSCSIWFLFTKNFVNG